MDAALHLGRHAEIVPRLQSMAARHPLREGLHGTLMLALARDGRQAEALAAYQRARRVIVAELGVEPGPSLRELHQRILSGDPALLADTEPARLAEPEQQRAMPQGLPPAVPGFTGRAAELGTLTQILDEAGDGPPGTVVISAIGGTAGVGKTTLALHWAHQVAGRFGDGQLHVNLRGFDPSGTPATPAEVIRGFLDTLGVPREQIPAAPDAQTSLYRSLLADRKMLIVLDNARDEDQVRPLLPASPGSLVLVTSRNQLSGLAAADGARLVELDIPTHGEAAQMLTARLASRAVAEPGAIAEIASLCAHLPLALAVAAARAATRPRFPLAALAAELRGTEGRLDVLDAGGPAASVRAVLSWSYSQLSPGAARMFRLLGLHPGPDISIPAAASLAATSQTQARHLLGELTRVCLATEHAPGRYAFHDLLRAYAAGLSRDCDPERDREAATTRILDHYLHTAAHCSALITPTHDQPAIPPPERGTTPEQPDDQQVVAWFDTEHQVLLAIVTLAGATGADGHAWQLPCMMAMYLHRRGFEHERLTLGASALAAATRLGDEPGQAMSHRILGSSYTQTGEYGQAKTHLERSVSLFRQAGYSLGEAQAQQNLAYLAELEVRYADALGHSDRQLSLSRAAGHDLAQAEALNNVAWFHALLGDYARARAISKQCLDLLGKLDPAAAVYCEWAAWDTLGYIDMHLGDYAQASAHVERALSLSRDQGSRLSEAEALTHLGDVRRSAGEPELARLAWLQALDLYDDMRNPIAGQVRAKLAALDGAPGLVTTG
jgi:tetratricopeptide (TPR) repeat protein